MDYKEIQKMLKDDIKDLFKLIENTRIHPKIREDLPDYNDYRKLISVLDDNLNKYWYNYNKEETNDFNKFINDNLNIELDESHKLMKHYEKQSKINIYRCLNSCWLDLLKVVGKTQYNSSRNQTYAKLPQKR